MWNETLCYTLRTVLWTLGLVASFLLFWRTLMSFICNSLHNFLCLHVHSMIAWVFKEMPCLIHPKINSVSIHRVYRLDLPNLPHQKYPFHCLPLLLLHHHNFQSAATDFSNIIMRDHFSSEWQDSIHWTHHQWFYIIENMPPTACLALSIDLGIKVIPLNCIICVSLLRLI